MRRTCRNGGRDPDSHLLGHPTGSVPYMHSLPSTSTHRAPLCSGLPHRGDPANDHYHANKSRGHSQGVGELPGRGAAGLSPGEGSWGGRQQPEEGARGARPSPGTRRDGSLRRGIALLSSGSSASPAPGGAPAASETSVRLSVRPSVCARWLRSCRVTWGLACGCGCTVTAGGQVWEPGSCACSRPCKSHGLWNCG